MPLSKEYKEGQKELNKTWNDLVEAAAIMDAQPVPTDGRMYYDPVSGEVKEL